MYLAHLRTYKHENFYHETLQLVVSTFCTQIGKVVNCVQCICMYTQYVTQYGSTVYIGMALVWPAL